MPICSADACPRNAGINLVLISRTEAKLQAVAAELEAASSIQTKVIAADFSRATEDTWDSISAVGDRQNLFWRPSQRLILHWDPSAEIFSARAPHERCVVALMSSGSLHASQCCTVRAPPHAHPCHTTRTIHPSCSAPCTPAHDATSHTGPIRQCRHGCACSCRMTLVLRGTREAECSRDGLHARRALTGGSSARWPHSRRP